MNIRHRKAQLKDLTFLAELEKVSFSTFQQNSSQNIRRAIKSSFQEIFIVELPENQKIGSIVLFKYVKSLRIYSIAILPQFQKNGWGKEILDFIKDYAIKNNFERLTLEVSVKKDKLKSWYQKFGFYEIQYLNDYYMTGEAAIKMELKLENKTQNKAHKNVIVIDQPFTWEGKDNNVEVISVKEYINNSVYQNNANLRIFNLCSSYKYQSYGYYVSLLASARNQRVIPNISTITDFQMINVIQSVAFDLDETINEALKKVETKNFSLDIYFGQSTLKEYKSLANGLYQIFEAPLFRVNFIKDDKWLIKSIKTLSFKQMVLDQKEIMYDLASSFFNKKRHNYPQLTNYQYDMAILYDPKEENPPSDKATLEKFKIAANKKGVYLEFITKEDKNKINEFDALFIRETTNVNHHTYEFSRYAYAEGLVVLDDPWSILKCSNKIYQSELFKTNKIRTPHTFALTKNLFDKKSLEDLNFPLVLKQPDSAFSLGVIKVNNAKEAETELNRMFKTTDMVVCQEFLYSQYDWRIGVLDNQVLFACKYYMAKDHWQVYDWSSDEKENYGKYETLPLEEVPLDVKKLALKATSFIGDGLYGVDLKYVDGKVYVIEVNDNPNIYIDGEDDILKDKLYEIIIDSIINRIEIAKNIRKISLVDNKVNRK